MELVEGICMDKNKLDEIAMILNWLLANPGSTAYEVARGIGNGRDSDALHVLDVLLSLEMGYHVRAFRKNGLVSLVWEVLPDDKYNPGR